MPSDGASFANCENTDFGNSRWYLEGPSVRHFVALWTQVEVAVALVCSHELRKMLAQ